MTEEERTGTKKRMSKDAYTVAVPQRLTRRAHIALVFVQVVAFMIAPYMIIVFLNEPKRDAYRGLVEGYQDRVQLRFYWGSMMLLYTGVLYLAKFILLNFIASPLSALVGKSTGDDELRVKVLKRFRRSFFIYGAKGVPRPMRRIRLSGEANRDGTYWMMTVDQQLRILSFQKYLPGAMKEPNNPDSPSIKYLAGQNPWDDDLK